MPSGRTKAHTRALRHVFTVLHAGVRRHASTQCNHLYHRRRANPESDQVAGDVPIIYLNGARLGSVKNGTNSIYINGLQHCIHPSRTILVRVRERSRGVIASRSGIPEVPKTVTRKFKSRQPISTRSPRW
jgi:hypothetical protein